MKNLIFALALIFAAFFNACQENSITNPITTENSEENIAYKINPGSNTIILDTWLLDPRQGPGPCSALRITGTIDFGVSSNIGNQISANNGYNTVVKMTINAELKPTVPVDRSISYTAPHYSVYKKTLDYLMLDPFGAREYPLIKQYEIAGCGNLHLVCTFGVTAARVTLRDIKLCCDSYTIYPALD
jgi:hypothetical protein